MKAGYTDKVTLKFSDGHRHLQLTKRRQIPLRFTI